MNKRSRRGELRREALNNRTDAITHVPKRVSDWHQCNRLTVTSLSKDYLSRKIELHLHVTLKPGLLKLDPELVEFCAVFEYAPSTVKATAAEVEVFKGLDSKDGASDVKDRCLNESVFVGVVQLMQKPKRVSFSPVVSVIRLKPLQYCNVFALQAIADVKSVSVPITVEPTTLVSFASSALDEDRETMLHLGLQSRKKDELKEDVVQCRPEVMGDLSNDYSPLGLRECDDFRENDKLSCFRISIDDESFSLECLEPINRIIESIDLFVCNREFETWTEKGVQGLYSHHAEEAEESNDATGRGNPVREIEPVLLY